ncbi:MAG: hypothetical protein ACREYF_24670 [Gammaproteobacteria bacterium]
MHIGSRPVALLPQVFLQVQQPVGDTVRVKLNGSMEWGRDTD